MLTFFPDNYPWNVAASMALQLGGRLAEINEACAPLQEYTPQAVAAEGAAAISHWWECWSALATRVQGLAEKDRAAGHQLSAGGKFLRASIYHMMAERMASHRDPRKMQAYQSMQATFCEGVRLRRDALSFVSIPYEGVELPALFIAPAATHPVPCMIHFSGFDVHKELNYLCEMTTALLARGIAVLHVDHPGVGEALRILGLPAIADTERPAAAAVDWLEHRAGIDAKRIGIIAPSLGGYFAARAAAFEPRLACCVAWGARFNNDASHGRILRDPKATRSLTNWLEHAMWVYGTTDVESTAKAMAALTLEGGVAESIRCPLLITHGINDSLVRIDQAQNMYEHATGAARRELKIFRADEGGIEHCGVDNWSIQVDYMADWIAGTLGGHT